jgi:hypothetical protein
MRRVCIGASTRLGCASSCRRLCVSSRPRQHRVPRSLLFHSTDPAQDQPPARPSPAQERTTTHTHTKRKEQPSSYDGRHG